MFSLVYKLFTLDAQKQLNEPMRWAARDINVSKSIQPSSLSVQKNLSANQSRNTFTKISKIKLKA